MEIDEVIDEIKSIVTVNTEKQAEALNWAVNYMMLLKSALKNYKDRKVEMVAMLEELHTEIEGMKMQSLTVKEIWNNAIDVCSDRIQQKIEQLKGE